MMKKADIIWGFPLLSDGMQQKTNKQLKQFTA